MPSVYSLLGIIVLGSILFGTTGCITSREFAGLDTRFSCGSTVECPLGSICDQGICWGGDVDLDTISLVIDPHLASDPTGELVATEITTLSARSDGFLENLQFADSDVWTGTVTGECINIVNQELCGTNLPARVEFRTPSGIAGVGNYRRTTTTTLDDGFSIAIPVSARSAQTTVAILPDEGALGITYTQALPATIFPPQRFAIPNVVDTQDLAWLLPADGAQIQTITGTLSSSGNTVSTFEDWKVTVTAQTSGSDLTERISNIGMADASGNYSLVVPHSSIGTNNLMLVATPPDTVVAPTVKRPISLAATMPVVENIEIPFFTAVDTPEIYVRGTSGSGDTVGVAGASVTIRISLPASGNDTSVYSATRFTGDLGKVNSLPILRSDSTLAYTLSVVTPPSSEHHSMLTQQLDYGPSPQTTLPGVTLQQRSIISGRIVDATGEPVEASLRATIREDTLWNAPLSVQDAVSQLQTTTSESTSNGEFALFLEPNVGLGDTVVYEIDVTPVGLDFTPTTFVYEWTGAPFADQDVGSWILPKAIQTRMYLQSQAGSIGSGSIRVYQDRDDIDGFCLLPFAPANCALPTRYRGIVISGDDGFVRLPLPPAQ